jgi:hypothetical protein
MSVAANLTQESNPLKPTLWLGAMIMLVGTAVTLVVTPLRICPDCEGTGVALVVLGDEESLVTVRGDPPTKCARCQGHSKISAFRMWTTKPEPTYVGSIQMKDWPSVERLSKREQLGLSQGEGGHGSMGIEAESPRQARRAREIIERDAREKGYDFRGARFIR